VTAASRPRPGPAADRYVSRGGAKLAHALARLGVSVAGRRALDAGASTGGFTDCLLRLGASRVLAVDVAYGALAWRLRTDPRVRVLERTNVRRLDLRAMGEPPVDLVVADLSFISLRVVRDALAAAAAPDADLVLLVKPQFEAPRDRVSPGGVVRDPATWRDAMRAVADAYREAGFALAGACASPLVGPAGNREFFLHLRRDATDAGDEAIDRAIEEAP
jgi:23S rRNA (cytidine1920-2'-O)/16S rRNA (cytidine1409-2'-O)-methyltransferase